MHTGGIKPHYANVVKIYAMVINLKLICNSALFNFCFIYKVDFYKQSNWNYLRDEAASRNALLHYRTH